MTRKKLSGLRSSSKKYPLREQIMTVVMVSLFPIINISFSYVMKYITKASSGKMNNEGLIFVLV